MQSGSNKEKAELAMELGFDCPTQSFFAGCRSRQLRLTGSSRFSLVITIYSRNVHTSRSHNKTHDQGSFFPTYHDKGIPAMLPKSKLLLYLELYRLYNKIIQVLLYFISIVLKKSLSVLLTDFCSIRNNKYLLKNNKSLLTNE